MTESTGSFLHFYSNLSINVLDLLSAYLIGSITQCLEYNITNLIAVCMSILFPTDTISGIYDFLVFLTAAPQILPELPSNNLYIIWSYFFLKSYLISCSYYYLLIPSIENRVLAHPIVGLSINTPK